MSPAPTCTAPCCATSAGATDRKSTRLNSSHLVISYAVFCLKKKKNNRPSITDAATARDPDDAAQAQTGIHPTAGISTTHIHHGRRAIALTASRRETDQPSTY